MKRKWRKFTIVFILLGFILLPAAAGISHAASQQVTFAWEQELSSDLAGWRLYSSTQSGGPYSQAGGDILFTQAQTTYTHQAELALPDNAETKLYFVMKAFDTSGNESGPSNEVSHIFDFLGPPAPRNLNITLVVTVRTP